jgi:hypothetical protein
MKDQVDLSLELTGASFIEGSTIDATVRATGGRDVIVADGRVELVRTMTYRYLELGTYQWYPATARSSEVVSHSGFQPNGRPVDGQPLVQPVALVVPPTGRARSRRSWSTSTGWCRLACTPTSPERSKRPNPSWCCPERETARP